MVPDNDAPVYFPLSGEPKITYDCDAGADLYYINILSDGQSFRFDQKEQNKFEVKEVDFSSVNEILTSDEITVRENCLIVDVRSDKAYLTVAEINGVMHENRCLHQGINRISLADYQPGIYIVKVNSNVIKIQVR